MVGSQLVNLAGLFMDFCEHLDGKLQWSKTKGSDWTELIFKFFVEKATVWEATSKSEYLTIDLIWRNFLQDIVLAVEHEGAHKNVIKILDEEMLHLIDLRASAKVGIFYLSEADESTLIRNLRQRLAARQIKLDEQYMVIIGRSTRRQGKPSILFRRHLLGNTGKDIEQSEDIVISQKPKTLEKQSEG